jgi:hypothetical protein
MGVGDRTWRGCCAPKPIRVSTESRGAALRSRSLRLRSGSKRLPDSRKPQQGSESRSAARRNVALAWSVLPNESRTYGFVRGAPGNRHLSPRQPDILRRTLSASYLTPNTRRLRTGAPIGRCRRRSSRLRFRVSCGTRSNLRRLRAQGRTVSSQVGVLS